MPYKDPDFALLPNAPGHCPACQLALLEAGVQLAASSTRAVLLTCNLAIGMSPALFFFFSYSAVLAGLAMALCVEKMLILMVILMKSSHAQLKAAGR